MHRLHNLWLLFILENNITSVDEGGGGGGVGETERVAVLSTCYHDIPWIKVTTFGYTSLFQLY
jgi:hypothetical protein